MREGKLEHQATILGKTHSRMPKIIPPPFWAYFTRGRQDGRIVPRLAFVQSTPSSCPAWAASSSSTSRGLHWPDQVPRTNDNQGAPSNSVAVLLQGWRLVIKHDQTSPSGLHMTGYGHSDHHHHHQEGDLEKCEQQSENQAHKTLACSYLPYTIQKNAAPITTVAPRIYVPGFYNRDLTMN